MNYEKIYNDLIKTARTKPFDGYTESHHIVPNCMGGTDKKTNLVKLSARQHFIAHWLLYKMYKTSSLVHAWNCMSRIGKGQEERIVNSKHFARIKTVRSKILSEESKGDKNHFYGKTHSQESKDAIRSKHIGKDWRSKESIDNWVETIAKMPKTKEHKEKIGRKNLVMLQDPVTMQIIRVPRESVLEYSGWVNPKKLKPEQKYACVHCGIVTIQGNLSRWHNDKCKKKLT